MRLRSRLFLLVAAVVVITVALVTWTVSSSARSAFEALDAQRTASLMAQFEREFVHERDQVRERVERIAESDEIRRAAIELASAAADSAAYVNAATPLAAAYGLDFLDIVASDGSIISSAHWPARFGYRQQWQGRERSDAFLHPMDTPTGKALGMVATHDIPAGGNYLYVVGGTRLDQQFLKSLSLPEGMRALLYRNFEPEVSGRELLDASGVVTQATPLEPVIARVREQGREAEETIEWPDGRERVHAIPLRGRDDAIVGVLLLASSTRQLDALVQRIRLSAFGLAVLGILLGGALSYAIAARVTRPVEQLAAASRVVASGDWTAPVDVRATGEIAELAGAFAEMTQQLADQRERLVQAERVAAWRELARRLAHELKNPLFPLRVTIDNLQRAKAHHPEQFDEVFEESVGTLRTGVANLNAVIARFGDFAKMPTPVFEQVSPNDIVRDAMQLFQAQLQAPGRPSINVSLDLDPEVGTVALDREQLGRAVQNLLLNAIDAMPGGGTVTVRTRRTNRMVALDITDTGEGLMDEERERLFTPYYTTKQHGTGLGLAIVQSVVSDHGGRIQVESQRGRGTTFHIELPVGERGAARS